MRKLAMVLCTVTVVSALLSLGTVGCTRGKKESPTPTVPVQAATPTRGVAATAGATTIGPSTGTTPEAGPTTVTAGDTTATPEVVVTVVPAPTTVPQQIEYTVQWGDTLTSIAASYGTTPEAIMALNGMSNANLLSVGQVLRIPGQSSAPAGPNEYIVVAGDTLFSIARRFGTTVEALQGANGIANPALIRVGQRLTIPQSGSQPSTSTPGTYVVRAGDTLYGIATALGKNVQDIIAANHLAEPYVIVPGQVLTIP